MNRPIDRPIDRNWRLRLASLTWLLALAGGACAEPPAALETPRFQLFGSADGLPSSNVFAVEVDGDGRLWVGTGDGLARFDGVEFQVFQHDPGDPGSLPSNVIQALHIDAAGRVWVGTEGGGLSRLDPAATAFRHYRRAAPEPLALDDVWAITSTPDGALWFGGYGGGLYRLAPDDDRVQAFRHAPDAPDSLASDHVLALAVDRDGVLWIGGSAGLDRWTGSGFAHHRPGPDGPSAALILSLTAEADGTLWIGSGGGLDRRGADGRIAPAPQAEGLAQDGVMAVVRDGPDSFWIGSRNRLHRWRDGRFDRTLGAALVAHGVRAGAVFDIARDAEGGLWFAHLSRGLLHLPPGWRDFSVLSRGADAGSGLQSDLIRAAAPAAGGGWWVVGDGAFDRLGADGVVTPQLGPDLELPNRRLSAVLETADGTVWIGHHRGLSRYRPDRRELRHWLAGEPDAPPAGPVDLLIGDGAGGLWLSAHGGGIERRAADGRVLARFDGGDGGALASAETEQLALAPDGRLWLAGDDGLRRSDRDGRRLEAVAGGPSERVYSFAFGRDGTLWTHRFGALEQWRLDGERLQRLQRIGAEHGLPPMESGGIAVAADAAVWLTSRRGLWRAHPRHGVRVFGVRDGLRSHEFVDRPLAVAADGRIAAGTMDSLVLFDPAAIAPPPPPPPVRVHELSVVRDGERIVLDPAAPIELRHGDRELRVVARLLSFTPPQARRYRVRLHGFDDDWIDVGAAGERVYSRLPAGAYRLAIEGAGPDGHWRAAPTELAVSVRPPWWATGPALAGELLLALAALFALVQRQRRRSAARHAAELAERQRRWALQASEAKSRFLATLGHEIRTPMTGVLGMTELLLAGELAAPQRRRAEAIQRSGELMLRLVNDALDLARIEAGKLSLLDEPFELAALLRRIGESQAALAAAKGLRFELQIDPALDGWYRGDRLRLEQVLLNLTGNAIKFTERGHVALRAAALASGVEIEVEDTGPGLGDQQRARLFQRFEQADGARTAARYGGSGLGLAISQELVAAMGGRIELDSTPGVGSRFRVTLLLPPSAPPAASTPARPALGRMRLLLVEDDPTVADVIAGLLAADGHAVVHAPHGLAALAECEPHDGGFDAALLDLDLPGVDGLTLAGLLRARVPGLPLLALTARADPDAEPAARAAGFDRFLRKPVDRATLAAALATLPARRPAAKPVA